ncbi:Uncharacterised protein [Legionella pneumophila]|nr:Uncharacterised protein [Legionella pneumophila]
MNMIKSTYEFDMPGQQHAISKDIPGHISYANHSEIIVLDISVQFIEMAFNRFPCPFSSNPHFFMIITNRAT